MELKLPDLTTRLASHRSLLLFFYCLLHASSLQAQPCDCAREVDFVVSRYEQDYSGMPDLRAKWPGYRNLFDSVLLRSRQVTTVAGCDTLIGTIIKALNNKHVFYGQTANNPDYREEAETTVAPDKYPSFQRLNKRTVYLKVPSSDLSVKDSLKALLHKATYALITSRHLVLDLRDNGGGGDAVLDLLLPYLYTQPIVVHQLELWSSPNNTRMFEDLLQNEYLSAADKETIRQIVAKAKNSPNQFVSLTGSATDTLRFARIAKAPATCSILINENCMSATENFLLKARQSSKVRIFGSGPTAGGVDYGDLNFVTLPSGYWYIAVPTTRSTRLPHHPVDNIGIRPDVLLNPAEKDAVSFILNTYLR